MTSVQNTFSSDTYLQADRPVDERARDLVIWGATGQAGVLAEFAGRLGWRIVALVDREPRQSPVPGVPVLLGEAGFRAWLAGRGDEPLAGAVAIGGSHGRDRRLIAALLTGLGLDLPAFVHPTALLAADSIIGQGTQICLGARVCARVRVGRSAIVNTGASIDHDGVVGDGAHLAPGATLAGEVVVEEDAFVGTGAIVLPRLTVGAGAVVAAGAVVIRSVAPGATVMGNPASARPSA